jgi:exosortase K
VDTPPWLLRDKPVGARCRRNEAAMNSRSQWNRIAQLLVVLLSALTLKQFYSTASVNQLRWILTPTTLLIERVTGWQFEFESHAGYLSSDRSFLIAASCAGVNFLITAFLMLSLRRLLSARDTAWRFIPAAALVAYLATLVANTVRISTAIRLQPATLELGGLSRNQLHRSEGIFIYFGFLVLLFMLSEKVDNRTVREPEHAAGAAGDKTMSVAARRFGLLRQAAFPLLIYYATTLGVPFVAAAFRTRAVAADLWEHSIFVLLTPLLVLLPLAMLRFGLQAHRDGKVLPFRKGYSEFS